MKEALLLLIIFFLSLITFSLLDIKDSLSSINNTLQVSAR